MTYDAAIYEAARLLMSAKREIQQARTEHKFIKFTKGELQKMNSAVVAALLQKGSVAHCIKRMEGNGFTYEIRFRGCGVEIEACSDTLERAKLNFINKTNGNEVFA